MMKNEQGKELASMAAGRSIGQYREECRFWEESMVYLQQENLHMKTRLGAVIPFIDKGAMEEIERYQNLFLTKDMAIALYRKDILEHQRLLTGMDASSDEVLKQKARVAQRRLRADMRRLEQECSSLKFDFNEYLEKVLG
jgi:hypothetical protein